MKKRALLVGINYIGTSNQLKGCINDSHNMETFLKGKGFTDIKLILETEATTSGIINGLNWLISDVSSGDVIIFHYSGHGSQLPSSSESDGYEEIICPIDLNWMDKIITDATLRDIFNKVPNGVNTTVVLDCCHSGTMLNQAQSLNGTKELKPGTTKKIKGDRYLKPPAKITKKLADKNLVQWHASRDVNASALLIAGCHANQTSADTIIDGVPQGAATAALLKSAKANAAISYKTLITEMDDFMIQNKYEQIPELDGNSSLYDQIFLAPFSFAIPVDVPDSTLIITPVTASNSNNSKTLLIIAIIAVLITLIIVL